MAIGVIGGATALVGAGLNVYNGLHQQSQANDIKKSLKDPIYNIPNEFYQNKAIAQQMAQVGLPQQQYNNAANQINQNQAGALAAYQPGRGNLAAIVRQGDAATNNLNAEDATARGNNQRYSLQVNKDLANQELAKQQSDVFDKYTRNYNEAAALQGAGQQNVNSGINGIVSTGLTALNAYGNQGMPSSLAVGTPKSGGNWGSDLTKNPNFAYGYGGDTAPQQFQPLGLGTLDPANAYLGNPSYQKYNYNPYQ